MNPNNKPDHVEALRCGALFGPGVRVEITRPDLAGKNSLTGTIFRMRKIGRQQIAIITRDGMNHREPWDADFLRVLPNKADMPSGNP